MQHSEKSTIEVVLNGGIRSCGAKLFLSSTERVFFTELVALSPFELLITASCFSEEQTFCDWQIDLPYKTFLFPNVPKSPVRKIYYYAKIALFSLVRKSADFSHVYFPGNFSLAILVGRYLRNLPYSLYFRGEIRYRSVILRRFAEKVLAKATFILATGHSATTYARQFNSQVEEVIPMMRVSRSDLWKRDSFDLSDPIRILYFSRVERDKGIFECIEAVKILLAEGLNITFDIAGGGDACIMDQLFRETLSIKEHVIIHGQISDKEKMSALFKMTDLYLFTSYHEGFPRVLYEAMTYSTPIITTDILGIAHIMKHKYNCYKVPVRDHLALAKAIRKLLIDEALRRSIGEYGYKTMSLVFDLIANDSHAQQLWRGLVHNNFVTEHRR